MAKTEKNIKASEYKQAAKKARVERQRVQNEDVKKNDEKHIDERALERNKYVFELVNMWIANVDNKINIAFAMLSALLAAVVFISDSLLSDMSVSQNARPCLLYSFYIASVIAAVCFCISVSFYVLSIIPRLTSDKSIMNKQKKNDENKEVEYSLFYNEIKDFGKAEYYIKSAKTINADMFNEEILKEIYYNSGICAKKMHCFKLGGLASFATITISMIAALLYFLYALGV